MSTPQTFSELMQRALEMFPDCEVLDDLEGQLIIYTGLRIDRNSADERLAPVLSLDDPELGRV